MKESKKTTIDNIINYIIAGIIVFVVLAAIIIPAISCYNDNYKNVTARKEVDRYVAAYQTWLVLTSEDSAFSDFKSYCIDKGLFDDKYEISSIEQRKINDNKLSYDHGFIYHATNGRLITYVYNKKTDTEYLIIGKETN